jgi:hypothetical protein
MRVGRVSEDDDDDDDDDDEEQRILVGTLTADFRRVR